MLLSEKYRATVKEMEDAFSKFERIILLYSGGKDSTLLVLLSLEAMENLSNELIIATSDTRVDIPWLERYRSNALSKIKEFANQRGFKVQTRIVRPQDDYTFWTNMLGRGYVMPHFRFRWCMRVLKIQPMKSFIKENPGLILMGVRWGESKERDRNMRKRDMKGKWTSYYGIKEAKVFLPIINWTTEEVLSALSYSPLNSWINGNFRTGCWVCSVVRRDKCLYSLANNGFIAAKYLLDFKNRLIRTTWNEKNRVKTPKGPGKLKMNIRKKLLEEVIDFSERMKEHISKDIITAGEIKEIQRMLG